VYFDKHQCFPLYSRGQSKQTYTVNKGKEGDSETTVRMYWVTWRHITEIYIYIYIYICRGVEFWVDGSSFCVDGSSFCVDG